MDDESVDAHQDFVQHSSLSYFIPRATEFQLSDIFNHNQHAPESLLESIEQRESLFFDESVDVILVLATPYLEDNPLRAALQNFSISLDVQVINGNATDRDSSNASETINSSGIDGAKQSPDLVQHVTNRAPSEDGKSESYIYAVWKLPVFLNRSRLRLSSPSVVFNATAGLRPANDHVSKEISNSYMPSGVASGFNLLESFGNDPSLRGTKPRLSALRVSRVTPITNQSDGLIHPIKALSKLSLRIYPAMHSRIRFTHLNTAPASAAVVAMLEIDFTPFFECEIILNHISLAIAEATVENLTNQPGLALPLSCVSHDHIAFMYRIAPVETDIISKNHLRDLDITISATALVNETTQPRLKMAWTATVDFTIPVNPGYGSTTQPLRRSHRPSQLSIGGDSTVSFTAPSVARPDALPSLEAATPQPETTPQDLGITVTFTPPPQSQKISVGDEFLWSVFIVNHSNNGSKPPRKLALVVIPKRRRNETRVNRPPSMGRAPDALQSKGSRDHRSVAEAVLDDNLIHAMQRTSIVDAAEIVCLSADVRIGPLAPAASHITELKFLALEEGLASLEAVRIIDLGNNEHVDIKQLPTVIVHPKETA
ncbi:TRAPP trafficking subunit Trs65-domain-containing protein [Xylariaceae sp. FL0255]|nr:TRAPP trafficking subunit Trs65-domain-containing protein [Xylariaceae sp. FL0255]